MASKHSLLMTQIMMDWSQSNRGRLFPNRLPGKAWQGTWRKGLPVGSSDLVGEENIEIEYSSMKKVGCFCSSRIVLPIFCAIEVKTLAYPKLSEEQIRWLNFIKSINGRAYIACELKDGGYVLEEWGGKE